MADVTTTSIASPLATPEGTNQTQPLQPPPAAPGAMSVYNEVTKQYDQVATQGLTQQNQQQIAGYKPMEVPWLKSSQTQTPTISGVAPGTTLPTAMQNPGTLVSSTPTGQLATGTGTVPITEQSMLQNDASRREAGIQEVMKLNQISYDEAAKRYDTATGNIKLQSVQSPSVMNDGTKTSIETGLYGSDVGVLTTNGYNTARTELGGVISRAEQSPLTSILSESESQAQALIKANVDEYNRLVSFAAGTTPDPMLQQLITRQQRLATQMNAAITDIHAQATESLIQQEKTNKELMGKAKAAVNAAGQVGSMVGEGYLAAQLQNNLNALQSIKNSEQKAINDARQYFENAQDDLAFKQVEIIEQRRKEANEILQQNFTIGQQLESMKMQRQEAARQAQLTEMQMRKEGRATAEDFLSTFAKQGLAPESVPNTVWETAVQQSGGAITTEMARSMYTGSLRDQQAKDVQAFNENTKAFYAAASQIKDPNITLYRPNMDGTFTSVKRSEVQLSPDLESFEMSENGKKYRMYVDKNNLDAAPTKIQIGEDNPSFEYFEDGFGNQWRVDSTDRQAKPEMVLDFAGNPATQRDVSDTANFVNNQGYNVTDPDATDVGSANQIGGLSSKFESNGNPGAIGYDRTGGYSYGTYQLAHNNALDFVKKSPYANAFAGIPFNSPEFQQKWKELAKTDPQGFEQAQHDYIQKTHYDPQVRLLSKNGIDVSEYSPVMKDVIWSTCVQNGPQTNVCKNAIKKAGPNASEEDIIKAIYKERWGGGASFGSSTQNVKNSVYKRFFGPGGEQEQALKRLHAQQTNIPADNAMAWAISAPEDAPVRTNVKNGIVESIEQVGTNRDGSPMMMAMVRDSDSGTLHRFSGMKFSDLKEGMAWGASSPAPQIGEAGRNGYSEALYNQNGDPIQPTGEVDIQKYGTWGRLGSIPPKLQPELEKLRNDIEGGKIDLDTAVRRVKSSQLLSQVRSDVILDDLGSSYKYASGLKREAELAKQAAAQEKQMNKDYTQQDNLRKEAQGLPEIKEFKTTRDSYSIINDLASNRGPDGTLSGAGDMSLVFAYMKMLDPGSTVREGEFANAENAGGVSAKIQNLYNKALKGNRLTKKQVDDFQTQANALYQSKQRQVQPTLDYYKNLAQQRGFDPNEIIPDISYKPGSSQQNQPVQSIQSGQTWTDPTTGETYLIE